MLRKISPAMFALILLCFFLPWITVSCQNQKIVTFNGMQLVAGTTIEIPRPYGIPEEQKIPGDRYVILTFLFVCTGLILSLLKYRKTLIASSIMALGGVISLILFKSRADNNIIKKGYGLLNIDYLSGFYLTLFLLLGIIGLNIYIILQEQKKINLQESPKLPDYKICSQCNTENEPGSKYCKNCGNKLD